MKEKTVMMKALLRLAMPVLVLFLCVGSARAGNDAEVKALVEKAVTMVEKSGLDATLKAINDLKGPFVQGDLYIFAMSLDNLRLATGSLYSKHLLGTVGKKELNTKMAEMAKKQGSGWIEYSWPKPNQTKPSLKRSYVMRVPGKDAYFGCGYYLK